MSGYDRFKLDAGVVLSIFTGLHLHTDESGVPDLRGMLHLNNKHEIIDSYNIRIVPSTRYPNDFPSVFEIGGRIPINIDWHVYSDGHFCLCTIPEEMLKCKRGFTLKQFIEEDITPYLFNQTHRRVYGYFIKERKHGFEGELEYLYDILHLKNVIAVARFFAIILKRKEPGRTEDCFCGSRAKYRNCHREIFRMFSQLDNNELNFLYQRIIQSNVFKECLDKLK